MPRSVRNFWLELSVQGRKDMIKAGPRSADGGFVLTVRQRCRGKILTAGRLIGYANPDGGQLVLEWAPQEVEACDGTIRDSTLHYPVNLDGELCRTTR